VQDVRLQVQELVRRRHLQTLPGISSQGWRRQLSSLTSGLTELSKKNLNLVLQISFYTPVMPEVVNKKFLVIFLINKVRIQTSTDK
jgi:hypothetical protein